MPPAKPAEPTAAKPAEVPEAKPAEARPKALPRLWEALANLSISRTITDPKSGEKMADIVHRGETVELDEDTARGFLTRHRRAVIRPAKDQDDPAPAIRARDLFGERPRAEQFGARPDPPGASRVEVNEEVTDPADPRNAPEATDPKTDFSVDPDAAKDR
jgi:hypothetical protein